MLSSMLILVGDGTVAQVVVAILLSLVSVKVYGHYHPYADNDDDILAEAAQWDYFLVLFLALLIRVDATGDSPKQQRFLGITLISMTSAAFIIMFLILLQVFLRARRAAVVPQLPAPAVGGGEAEEGVGGRGGAGELEVDGKGEVEIAVDGKNSAAPLEVCEEVEGESFSDGSYSSDFQSEDDDDDDDETTTKKRRRKNRRCCEAFLPKHVPS